MKKLEILFIGILFISITSCSKEEQKPFDESIYYDQDEDCGQSRGTCCDTDGRILVLPNQIYSYTYFNNTSSFANPNYSINWEVLEGSITLISGQNSSEAKFKFGSDFTIGKISATGKVDSSCCECNDVINITKL
jgi:hypothetical protein